MKTRIILLVFLLIGIASTSLFAQDYPPAPDGTKSVTGRIAWFISEEVYCDGVFVEFMWGPMVWHNISHYKNGVKQWEIGQGIGTIISSTGEVFKVNEVVKQSIPIEGKITCNTNLVGNKGSHYILHLTFNSDWSGMEVVKINCPGYE